MLGAYSSYSISAGGKPLLLALDYGAAFATVTRRWLWRCLKASGLPQGFLSAMEISYSSAACWITHAGGQLLAFYVNAGILQGCPSSGLAWSILSNPFLASMQSELQRLQYGQLRACADDVGAALRFACGLRVMYGHLNEVEAETLLRLKIAKCFVVPLWAPLSDDIVLEVRSLLGTYAPGWAGMQITDCLQYLGVILGPGSQRKAWVAPLENGGPELVRCTAMVLRLSRRPVSTVVPRILALAT